MPTIEENASPLYGEPAGSVLVLLRNGGKHGGAMARRVERVDGAMYLTPDLWGHGRTSFWPDPNTLLHDDQADLVKRILEEVGVEKFDLVGHSYGGGTAIRFVWTIPRWCARSSSSSRWSLVSCANSTKLKPSRSWKASRTTKRLDAEGPKRRGRISRFPQRARHLGLRERPGRTGFAARSATCEF